MDNLDTYERSWAVDTQLSNIKEDPKSKDFLLETIEGEISKSEKNEDPLVTESSEVNESLDLYPEEIPDFKIPDIPQILSTENNSYIANSQKWIGHIIEVKNNSFVAELDDINNPTTKEIAEFEFKEISPEDRPFIQLGSVFYYSIGYASSKGTITKESFVRFQRLPDWSIEDYDKSADRGRELNSDLNWISE